MTPVIKNDRKKKRRFQIFRAGVEPTETDMFLPPTSGRNKETTQVWKCVAARRDEIKTTIEYQLQRCKYRRKLRSHFAVSFEKGSYTRHAALEMKPTNKHVRTITENQEENSRSVSALSCSLSLSSHGMWFLFVQLTRTTQFSYSLSLSWRLLKKCSSEWTFV